MFFLHHAVCSIHIFAKKGADAFVVQMVDKVWFDWQNKNASNKNVFAGGTVSWQASSSVLFLQYPTGAPPWLNVRIRSLIH